MLRILSFILCILFLPNLYAETGFKKICIRNICIQAEIADSFESRQHGLMFREKLTDNQGMLFIFENEDIQIFWMKNMILPLDMIWIGVDKIIVEIKENVPPCAGPCKNIIPAQKARYVLEVNAGFVKRNRIRVGNKLEF